MWRTYDRVLGPDVQLACPPPAKPASCLWGWGLFGLVHVSTTCGRDCEMQNDLQTRGTDASTRRNRPPDPSKS